MSGRSLFAMRIRRATTAAPLAKLVDERHELRFVRFRDHKLRFDEVADRMNGEAFSFAVVVRGCLRVAEEHVVQREAVVQVIAVADDVGVRNAEKVRFNVHGAAERVGAVADHQVGFKRFEKLRVVEEKTARLSYEVIAFQSVDLKPVKK